MTYLEVLKILRKHRILIVGKILDKRNSVNNDHFSEDKELKFSFLFFKRIGREEFERIGIDVGSRCDIAVDRTVDVFKIFDALTDQNQHLTVYASSFIIGNVGELV